MERLKDSAERKDHGASFHRIHSNLLLSPASIRNDGIHKLSSWVQQFAAVLITFRQRPARSLIWCIHERSSPEDCWSISLLFEDDLQGRQVATVAFRSIT